MKEPIYHRIFNYNKDLLPNQHLQTLEEGVNNIDEALERSGFTLGYPGWGLIYHTLLSHLDRSKEEVILETGSNHGCTTIILAQALLDSGCKGRVVSIELEEDNYDVAKDNIEKAGLSDLVDLRLGDSAAVLPELGDQLTNMRFALLDASHLYDDVMFEFEAIYPHLSDDAIVMFDNTYAIAEEGEDPRVHGALQNIQECYGGDLINLEFVSWFTPGLAIWKRSNKFCKALKPSS